MPPDSESIVKKNWKDWDEEEQEGFRTYPRKHGVRREFFKEWHEGCSSYTRDCSIDKIGIIVFDCMNKGFICLIRRTIREVFAGINSDNLLATFNRTL